VLPVGCGDRPASLALATLLLARFEKMTAVFEQPPAT
jgi:hypothetical protein